MKDNVSYRKLDGKRLERQQLTAYLGMSPSAYVERGLAVKRSAESSTIGHGYSYRPTQVWAGGAGGRGESTSLTTLPPPKTKTATAKKPKRPRYEKLCPVCRYSDRLWHDCGDVATSPSEARARNTTGHADYDRRESEMR